MTAATRAPAQRTPLDGWAARLLGLGAGHLGRRGIEAAQLDRLRAALEFARRSPFYERRLQPSAIRNTRRLQDLAALPFTTPGELARDGPLFLAVPQAEAARVVTLQSSGTAGAPKRLYFTAAEQEATLSFFAAGMSTLVGRGDRVLILMPGTTPGSAGALLERALGRLGAEAVQHGFVSSLPDAARVLAEERPTALVGPPVHALALARFACAAGIRVPLRAALLTGDYVPGSLAEALRRAWGCEAFEHYGMTEMGLGGAVDCRAHEGCHVREAELLVEVVNPVTGLPATPGAAGEVVLTTLTPRAMPLVRYRTGDLSAIAPGRCSCGSDLLRLARVRGRFGAVRVAGIGLPELDEALFALDGVLDFTAAVEVLGPGRARLSLVLLVLSAGGPGADSALAALEALPALAEARRDGGIELEVTIERSATLRSTGARKRRLELQVPGGAACV